MSPGPGRDSLTARGSAILCTMTTTTAMLAFAVAAGLATMTPGLDTALVLRTATTEGRRSAGLAALGIATGVLVWGIATALGLNALFAASAVAYMTLKWVGAAYLLWLGWGMFFRPRRSFNESVVSEGNRGKISSNWFLRGMLTNLLNPKVGVFYVTLLPQFVPAGIAEPGALMVAFATIHAVEGILWFGLLITATGFLAPFLRRSRVVETIDRVTGAVLMAFGVRLALAKL